MTSETEKEALQDLIAESLALRAAAHLDRFDFPPESEMAKFREITAEKAEGALSKYERSLAVDTLAAEVIEKLRDDLARRSRVSGIIEVAINISAILLGLMGGAVAVFLDPATNANSVKIIAIAIASIATLQFIGNAYLKYLDHNR